MPLPRWLQEPQIWSAELDQIYHQLVVQPIMNDDESDHERKLGYQFETIRQNIIEFGVADFTTSYRGRRTLSPEEKVLLYCFVNMRSHFYSSYVNFRLNRIRLRRFVESTDRPVLIDIGCGPGTAHLAFCDSLFREVDVRYWGVDIAESMQAMARSFWNAAVHRSVVSSKRKPKYFLSWNDIPAAAFKKRFSILLNFAYFFASRSLRNADIRELATFVKRLVADDKVEQVLLSYTNSRKEIATSKYATFKKLLGKELAESKPVATEVAYRNRRRDAKSYQTAFEREFIVLKE